MLILTRRPGESIHIGDDVVVRINSLDSNKVSVAIQAPKTISIHRDEVYWSIQQEKKTEQKKDNNAA